MSPSGHWVVDRLAEAFQALSPLQPSELDPETGMPAVFTLYGQHIPPLLLNALRFRATDSDTEILDTCDHVKLMRFLAIVAEVADMLNPDKYLDQTHRLLLVLDAALKFIHVGMKEEPEFFSPNAIRETLKKRVRSTGEPDRRHTIRPVDLEDPKTGEPYKGIVCGSCNALIHVGTHDVLRLPTYLAIEHHVCGYDNLGDEIEPKAAHCGVRMIRLGRRETGDDNRGTRPDSSAARDTGHAVLDDVRGGNRGSGQAHLPGTEGAVPTAASG